MTRLFISAGITVGLLLSTAACGSGIPEPSSPTSSAPTVNIFTGLLPVRGSSVYLLSVVQASTVSITLASLTAGPMGVPVPATVGLALGTPPAGSEGCPRTIERRVVPALTAHIRTDRTATTHCVEVFDVGTLAGDVSFAVRIVATPVSNTSPSTTPAAGLVTFSSILTVQGSASRTVTASQAGSLSANLTAASPPNILVGLGLGIPRFDGGGCYLSTSVNTLTSAAVQVASAVDAGEFCVKIYDPGSLTGNVAFTIAAAHP